MTFLHSWADAEGTLPVHTATGDRKDLVDFVNNILIPVNAQRGDKLPVSTFVGMADGTFPQGSAAYEKRGIAVDVPEWIPENCIECNQCSFVCPHAVIRPVILSEEEAAKAPAGAKMKDAMRSSRHEVRYGNFCSRLHRLRRLRTGLPL